MKPTILTPDRRMCAISALGMMSSFCVVLKIQRLRSSIGRTTAVVPTGASIGVRASAITSMTPIAFGDPEGPISASMFCSARSFLTSFTLCVGSLASSSAKYSIVVSPTFFGNSATEFFCATPTNAVGPVAELTTPTCTCACATQAITASVAVHAIRLDIVAMIFIGPSSSLASLALRSVVNSLACRGSHHEAAAREHDLPAQVIRLRDAEQVDGARGLLDRAAAAERDHPVHEREHFRLHAHPHVALADVRDGCTFADRLRHPRADVAERHGVDVHVVASPFLRERAGDADDCGLAGGVRDLAGIAVQPRDRRHVDDLALDDATLVLLLLRELAQRLGGCTQQTKRRRRVHVEHRVPLLVGHLLDHGVPRIAGVVDDDVERAVAVERGGDEARRELRRRDVAHARDGVAAGGGDRLHGVLCRGGVDVVDDHAGTFGGELGRDRRPDAAPRSAHECHLARQLGHACVASMGVDALVACAGMTPASPSACSSSSLTPASRSTVRVCSPYFGGNPSSGTAPARSTADGGIRTVRPLGVRVRVSRSASCGSSRTARTSLITACGIVAAESSRTSSPVVHSAVTPPSCAWIRARSRRRPSLVSRAALASPAKRGNAVSLLHWTSLPIAT